MEGSLGVIVCMYMYDWAPLLSTYHNIVNQRYSRIKVKVKKKKCPILAISGQNFFSSQFSKYLQVYVLYVGKQGWRVGDWFSSTPLSSVLETLFSISGSVCQYKITIEDCVMDWHAVCEFGSSRWYPPLGSSLGSSLLCLGFSFLYSETTTGIWDTGWPILLCVFLDALVYLN